MLNIRHILPFTTPFIIGAVTALDMAIYKEILFKADRCYVVLRHKCGVVGDSLIAETFRNTLQISRAPLILLTEGGVGV